jgi:NADPH-dependent ferric siderophore reductase
MHGRVISLEWPTPQLARVVLNGDGLDGFEPSGHTDSYVNVAIPPPGAGYAAPFDLGELRELPADQRPYRRRYTIRHWDPAARRLTLDIVAHGVVGPGGAWATSAQPGDALVFTGPAGAYRPDPDADWHLLVGDESALPAIAASVEAVPPGTPTIVRLVCDGPGYELELACPGRLDLVWLHRKGAPGDESLLGEAVRQLDFPAGRPHAFVHGEAAETRAVRRHLLAERRLDPAHLSCSPYWRRGMTDEEWRRVKASWVAEQERDVP